MREFLYSRWKVFFLLVLSGFGLYAQTLRYPFVHDDVVFILSNPNISRWDNIASLFFHPADIFSELNVTTRYYRPLLEILNRLQFLLFGPHPFGFHLVNTGIHVLNGFLVYLVLTGFQIRRSWAFLGAIIFLIHPVQSEAVVCIAGISNVFVTTFGLGMVLCYLALRRSRAIGWGWGMLVCGVLALLSKEQAVIFPALLIVIELVLPPRSRSTRRWGWLGAGLALSVAYFMFRQMAFPAMTIGAFSNQAELELRLLTIPRLVMIYLGAVFAPFDLHYYRNVDMLAPKLTAFCALITTGSITGALGLAMPLRYRRLFVLGILIFGIALIPVLNIIPLINEYSLMQAADHFLYLPIVGLLLSVTALGSWAGRFVRQRLVKGMVVVLGIAYFGALLLLTLTLSRVWRAEVPLFERTVMFEPHFGRAQLLLGTAYLQNGQLGQAERAYGNGLRIMQDYVKKAQQSQARDVYLYYIKTAYIGLGRCRMMQKDHRGAIHQYQMALKTRLLYIRADHDDSVAANDQGVNWIMLGRSLEARRAFQQALVADHRNVSAMNNLGLLDQGSGKTAMACFWFERAVKTDPLFRPAWENLRRLEDL